ncbi:Alpha/Beta hydrolase protein [Xylogone sp. PMI_703]|nr:Alpha/Beta hydrolase protein [Xylogone sp. PMI_703]
MTAPLITRQPFKALYLLGSLAFIGVRVPFWALYFIPASFPIIFTASSVEQGTETPLSGKRSKGWVVIHPARSDAYTGAVTLDKHTKPEPIGGTWYPKMLEKYNRGEIVLHIRGSGFVIGNGRHQDSGFTAKLILENTQAAYAFFPQYRLSSRKGNRFPAALQDVITSYGYLTETLNIPASNITISGDSASGNLALLFLRYLADNPDVGLPNPSCAWLWSPCSYQPREETGITVAHPNICLIGTPFATRTPIFFAAGECEAMYSDIIKTYEGLKVMPGNKVELHIESKATHDIVLNGNILGFEKEAAESVQAADKFLRACR